MLLSRDDVERRRPQTREAHQQPALTLGGALATVWARPADSLQDVLPALEPEQLYVMPCHATWSMHHLLGHVLHLVGASQVWLTSWTITESPVKSILQLVDAGLITQLRCVFDERAKKNNANAAQVAMKNVGEICFTQIHAKCMVITNAQHAVTVCSTANITRNKRIELYWISTHRAAADHHTKWLNAIMNECRQR